MNRKGITRLAVLRNLNPMSFNTFCARDAGLKIALGVRHGRFSDQDIFNFESQFLLQYHTPGATNFINY